MEKHISIYKCWKNVYPTMKKVLNYSFCYQKYLEKRSTTLINLNL